MKVDKNLAYTLVEDALTREKPSALWVAHATGSYILSLN